MKLIMEDPLLLDGSIEETLNESTGNTERNYYISGIFSTPEAKNRNGRVYSRSIWEREVAKYQKEINEKSVNTLGEWQHPPRSTVDPIKAVMRIVELKMDSSGNVVGKAKILNDNTEATNKLKGLIKEGVKIGVSSRGVGKVSATGVVEDFKLITYDAVDMPSDYNAMLNGMVEGYKFENGIMLDKEFTIDENGCIGEACSIMTESMSSKEIDKKLKELGYELASSMAGQKLYQKKGEKPYTDMVIVKGKKVDASNPETQKLLSENNIMTEAKENNEPCPIQEKINEAVAEAKKEIIEGMAEYMSKAFSEMNESILKDKEETLSGIESYINEKTEKLVSDISDYLENPVNENETKDSKKLDSDSAKLLIEALKNI